VAPADAGPNETEALFPERHELLLPLNNLNFYFDDFTVAFNQHTKLTCDRCVCVCVCVCVKLGFDTGVFLVFRNYFLDFDWTGLMSAIEQNFNPNPYDITKRENLGKAKPCVYVCMCVF
jgi:hypothetical protein